MMLAVVPLTAFLITVVLHAAALKYFPRMGLLDFPERYGHSRARLPYPTGIIAVLVFLSFLGALGAWSRQLFGIGISVAALSMVCYADDRGKLPAVGRLLVQASVAFLIFATGSRIYTLTNPLLSDGFLKLDTIDIMTGLFGPLPLWSGVFTIFWLMLTMNALNWFDGIPGQVSVLSFLGFVVIGALSLSSRVNQPDVALIAFVLAGIAAGGLLFDFPPNKVLMGDTGAMFFGLMLGVLTIFAGGKVATAFLVLGVPLIDVFIVVTRRILKGKNPLQGNATDEHLHHRLLGKGWSPRNIIALTAGIGALFGITALFLSTAEKLLAGLALLLMMIVLSAYSSTRRKA
ncbi:undecaprenyl/decaprenyl-phosphate alpha-N-acetylglucosaminyl 1-phosphate transferase [Candidatus Peregrinibacteria bacterium]|nr:undecaprenyl/decaprenyl-phosphate alpha-N-acetylglucosaminyl 1-phosphate transferase [Candidatus Peregrinibacteria bacterium]